MNRNDKPGWFSLIAISGMIGLGLLSQTVHAETEDEITSRARREEINRFKHTPDGAARHAIASEAAAIGAIKNTGRTLEELDGTNTEKMRALRAAGHVEERALRKKERADDSKRRADQHDADRKRREAERAAREAHREAERAKRAALRK